MQKASGVFVWRNIRNADEDSKRETEIYSGRPRQDHRHLATQVEFNRKQEDSTIIERDFANRDSLNDKLRLVWLATEAGGLHHYNSNKSKQKKGGNYYEKGSNDSAANAESPLD